VHVVERLYEAARCVHDDLDQRWEDHLRWAGVCRRGKVVLQLSLRHHRLFVSVLLAVAVAIHCGLIRRDGLASVYVFAASATARVAWSALTGRTCLIPSPQRNGISEEG
jgi:hypothetical protein